MEIKKIDINCLKPAEYNPRKDLKPTDKEYKKIKKSIEKFGYVDPVIINKDMTIIGGHQRYKVLKDLGFDQIECVIVDVDKNNEKALNIALNKITGEWDVPVLKDLLTGLNDGIFDIELTGFDIKEFEKFTMKDEKPKAKKVKKEEEKTFGVVIDCETELDQAEILLKLTKEGYSCKTLTSYKKA